MAACLRPRHASPGHVLERDIYSITKYTNDSGSTTAHRHRCSSSSMLIVIARYRLSRTRAADRLAGLCMSFPRTIFHCAAALLRKPKVRGWVCAAVEVTRAAKSANRGCLAKCESHSLDVNLPGFSTLRSVIMPDKSFAFY